MSDDRSQWSRNVALTAVAGQAGCGGFGIIIAALLLGIWLDAQAGTKGPFTIGLVVLSIPVCLALMMAITLTAIKGIRISPAKTEQQESPADEEPDA